MSTRQARFTPARRTLNQLRRVWQALIRRDVDGEQVCPRWKSDFQSFVEDLGPSYLAYSRGLRRVNVSAPYSPENCYWGRGPAPHDAPAPSDESTGDFGGARGGEPRRLPPVIYEAVRQGKVNYATAYKRWCLGWPLPLIVEAPPGTGPGASGSSTLPLGVVRELSTTRNHRERLRKIQLERWTQKIVALGNK